MCLSMSTCVSLGPVRVNEHKVYCISFPFTLMPSLHSRSRNLLLRSRSPYPSVTLIGPTIGSVSGGTTGTCPPWYSRSMDGEAVPACASHTNAHQRTSTTKYTVRHKTELVVRAIPRIAIGCNPTWQCEPVYLCTEPPVRHINCVQTDHGNCFFSNRGYCYADAIDNI